MKHNLWNIVGLVALIAVIGLLLAVAAHADSPAVTGSIAIDTPVISQPDRLQDRSTEAHLSLRLTGLTGPVALCLGGDMQLRPGNDFWGENKFRVGCELPLAHGLTPYVTFERRFDVNDNRYIAGVRWNFSSR